MSKKEKIEVKVIPQPKIIRPLKIAGLQRIELSSINDKLSQVRKSIIIIDYKNIFYFR